MSFKVETTRPGNGVKPKVGSKVNVHYTGKLTNGKVNWASRVADPAMIANPDFLARVVPAAHAAGLQVYPVFCVATEGGDERTNLVLFPIRRRLILPE